MKGPITSRSHTSPHLKDLEREYAWSRLVWERETVSWRCQSHRKQAEHAVEERHRAQHSDNASAACRSRAVDFHPIPSQTHAPVSCSAKFHVYWAMCHPRGAKKPIFGPLSKNNTGMAVLQSTTLVNVLQYPVGGNPRQTNPPTWPNSPPSVDGSNIKSTNAIQFTWACGRVSLSFFKQT